MNCLLNKKDMSQVKKDSLRMPSLTAPARAMGRNIISILITKTFSKRI